LGRGGAALPAMLAFFINLLNIKRDKNMEPKICNINDPECHLDRIRGWHGNLEANITTLIENLKNIREHSEEAKRACSEHYAKTVQLTKAKTRFTYEVSHELKAPLASVYNIINVILDGYLEKDVKRQKELLNRAKARINDVIKLLNDLLMFSHLEEGTGEIEIEKIDTGKLLSSLTEEMDAFASENNIKIDWNLSDSIPPIYGNPELLRRAFINIIHNAIKYSNQGNKVKVTSKKDNNTFLLRVKDQGIGIRKKELPMIFDIFFRGENARPEHKKEGMGLGLSLVKRIINAHGGTIKVKSNLNKGTTVEVSFPVIQKKEK
jgi:signal transduction histidine kinase